MHYDRKQSSLHTRLIYMTVWDSKPAEKGAPISWVELKTSAEIRDERGMNNFERKLMKFWIQSFLLGVPKIIVGFRSQGGILTKLEEIQTAKIPETAARRGVRSWDANLCINFASAFLECKSCWFLMYYSIYLAFKHCPPSGSAKW